MAECIIHIPAKCIESAAVEPEKKKLQPVEQWRIFFDRLHTYLLSDTFIALHIRCV